jgi:hypothetical protein
MQRARRSHARRAPFIHVEVEAGVTRRGFDTQRKTGGSGRPVLMASQQMERAAELQDPEIRVELNRCVHECERKCFASGRLGSIPQVCARARQQATREQVKGQWCESSTGTVCRRCDRARRSCRRLRGCADRVSAAHAREQWRLSCEQENPEVRGEVGLANQSGSIVSFHGPRRPTTHIPRQSSKQDHNTSRKLVNPLIELLRIPSPEHRCRGKVDYRCHGSP